MPVQIPAEDWLLWRPILAEPPLATLAEMQNGTYSIDDVMVMNLMLTLKDEVKRQALNG